MLRSRTSRILATLAGMVLVLYVLVSLYLPSPRRLTFGVDKRSGQVRLVEQNVTFLPPHRFYELDFEKREGAAQRDGLIRITSKEGVPVVMTYRLRFAVAGDRIADAHRLVTQGWDAWSRARVSEAVSAVTRQVPIEELLSPTSRFSAQRGPLKETVARHLASSGLKVTAFEIVRLDADREELLRVKRAELRRSARGVAGRVAIIGIDGADWELITELVHDDRLPNLEALIKGGATANMQTIQPTASPLVWATVATGVTPDRHGVIDFIDRAQSAPVDAFTRRAPALWDIAEAFSRHSTVVNWWTAWPPTSEATAYFDAPVQLLGAAVHPAQFRGRATALEVPASTIGYQQVGRFLNVSGAEYDRAVASGDPQDPINVFRNVLAKTWTDHRVAINLYQEQKPLLFMMSYEGTDAVNHLFAPYHPPYREGMSEVNYRKYWPAVANYYAEIDRLVGEWMNVLPEDTTVILMSAHGFRWGKNRPRSQPVGRAALADHRSPGFFVAYGNHVKISRGPASIYDIAPTALAILGLPSSSEMPGHVMSWAFRDITPVETVRVISYSEFVAGRPKPTGARLDREVYQRSLQAIGHMIDPSRPMTPMFDDEEDGEESPQRAAQPVSPEVMGQYAYWNNQGIELRKQGKTKEAVESFQRAIDLNPSRPAPYLNMAMVLAEKQQFTAAEEVFVKAVEKGLPNADQWFVDFAAMYRANDMPSRAIAVLYKGKSIFPQSYPIAANLGSALAQMNRYTEGLPELERALALQPSSTLVLNNLGIFYAKKNDYGRALDFWNRSLTIDPRQPPIRDAVNAARTRL